MIKIDYLAPDENRIFFIFKLISWSRGGFMVIKLYTTILLGGSRNVYCIMYQLLQFSIFYFFVVMVSYHFFIHNQYF